jgi:hypothetical protein
MHRIPNPATQGIKTYGLQIWSMSFSRLLYNFSNIFFYLIFAENVDGTRSSEEHLKISNGRHAGLQIQRGKEVNYQSVEAS